MILETTLSGIIVFTGVILLLVLLLNLAQAKLLPQGDVTLHINDDPENDIVTTPGSTLLTALATENVFLPSACGGGGTCAMCKCQVLEGGGSILPTETGHISRNDAKENWRLACQVKSKRKYESAYSGRNI